MHDVSLHTYHVCTLLLNTARKVCRHDYLLTCAEGYTDHLDFFLAFLVYKPVPVTLI